ncbi:hypothetical protein [Caldimonas caldifontis]|uniref:Uncharacterized protein n=1 Tax=Caldimonas caldifontis TaxID=1452508 RepID=A0A2S5SZ07_9BURK|nr:hypothetical protein [Caldimonas caldifontis]PPE68013.1 hypothetical protein C1704_00595 [Caldimonas caldifontis]
MKQVSSIVIDKDYLQGASEQSIRALRAKYKLVMPAALFYELITTDIIARRRCFAKLIPEENPVELVDHIGVLLRAEASTGSPSGPPSDHVYQMRYQFNRRLLAEDYVLPHEAREAISDMAQSVREDLNQLIELSEQTPSLFADLLSGSTEERKTALERARNTIANTSEVAEFYKQLSAPEAAAHMPAVLTDPGRWAHVRWLQVLMLFSTDLFVRYQGRLRSTLSPRVMETLEHDVHDAQMLVLGVLEGGLATKDRKLRTWFKLLNPSGHLEPPQTPHELIVPPQGSG